ncbi:MAG: helix-turn-helix domain-containing protein [Sphingopyxis sp.]|nr:helix-turn-helix domain-containing protein [Sphingopyxis sp.]
MSLSVPIEYTDARQMHADYAARRKRFFPSLALVNRETVGLPVRVEPPKLEPKSSSHDVVDIPNFLALRPKATEWLGMTSRATFRPSESTTILRLVYEHTGISQREIKSDRRTRDVVRPRMIACWLMRRCTTLSLPVIGRKLGGRDHTTVLHAVRVIDALRTEGGDIRELTDMLRRKVEEALALGRDEDDQP